MKKRDDLRLIISSATLDAEVCTVKVMVIEQVTLVFSLHYLIVEVTSDERPLSPLSVV